MAEEEKDDWLDDLDDDNDGASELDQSDIESLLSGDDDDLHIEKDDAADLSSTENAGEIDSADLDSLLPETSDEAPGTPLPVTADEDVGEGVDKSDIDALLSESEIDTDVASETIEDPDQNEIDKLFSEVDDSDAPEGDPFQAEEIDFKDVIGSNQDDDNPFDATGTAFDADEFSIDDEMADIPDLSDLESSNETTSLFDDNDQSTAAVEEPTDMMGDDSLDSNSGTSNKISQLLAAMPPILQQRRNQGIIGGVLIILILFGVFMFGGKKTGTEVTEQPVEALQPPTQQTPPVVPPPMDVANVNTPPVIKDESFSMSAGSNELAINLTAFDQEGDPLNYEVLSLPRYGKLSGQAPSLVYIANKEFSGQDNFMIRVSDGKNISEPATVTIAAPLPQIAAQILPAQPTTPPIEKTKVTVKPRKLTIAAKNMTYKVASTDDLIIDWEDIWSSANDLPFSPKATVEIISKGLHGTLKKLGPSQTLYTPDKYYGGKEKIKYRFKLGKLLSKRKELKVNVVLGTPPPTIKLAAIQPSYMPGETVVLDARKTRDEKRDSVHFTWQQVSGVPILFEPLNKEFSQVAFVVPSSFNTIANPGPMLRLIATDADGQKDTRDIKISTLTKRPTAVWRGLVDGGLADDPQCPYDNCPGGLLPGPYDY